MSLRWPRESQKGSWRFLGNGIVKTPKILCLVCFNTSLHISVSTSPGVFRPADKDPFYILRNEREVALNLCKLPIKLSHVDSDCMTPNINLNIFKLCQMQKFLTKWTEITSSSQVRPKVQDTAHSRSWVWSKIIPRAYLPAIFTQHHGYRSFRLTSLVLYLLKYYIYCISSSHPWDFS